MMNIANSLRTTFLLLFASSAVFAQDIVSKTNGEIIRATIKGTNYKSVVFTTDDVTLLQAEAKDVKEFVWNGESYISKLIQNNKKLESRFFKLVEFGTVNLYVVGDNKNMVASKPEPSRAKLKPNVSIGMGSGGLGGGLGGGISFGGGGNRNIEPTQTMAKPKPIYYIEKLGTGPLQVILIGDSAEENNSEQVKHILLQKLNGDSTLAEKISATPSFDFKTVVELIKTFNSTHK